MANQVLFELVVEGGVTARASPSFPLPTVTLIGNPQVVPGPDRTIEDGLRFGVKDMISVGTTPGSPRLRLPHEYTIDLWFRTCIFLAASTSLNKLWGLECRGARTCQSILLVFVALMCCLGMVQ